jgi:hypothetical protein
MWEYLTVEVEGRYFNEPESQTYSLVGQLNSLGQEGWEAVGVVPTDWENATQWDGQGVSDYARPTIGILLKRLLDE